MGSRRKRRLAKGAKGRGGQEEWRGGKEGEGCGEAQGPQGVWQEKGKDEPRGMGTARGPWEEERGRGMQRDGEEREVPGGRGCGGDSLRGAA